MATELDYGTDLSGVDDLDVMAAETSGRRLLAESLARRWTMVKGSAIDCPNDGYDVYSSLSASATPSEILKVSQALKLEAIKDERVKAIDVTVTVEGNGANRVLNIDGIVTDSDGPFPLTLLVSDVTVELLTAG